jgi:hypothetical protein
LTALWDSNNNTNIDLASSSGEPVVGKIDVGETNITYANWLVG